MAARPGPAWAAAAPCGRRGHSPVCVRLLPPSLPTFFLLLQAAHLGFMAYHRGNATPSLDCLSYFLRGQNPRRTKTCAGAGGKGWFSKDGQVWENGALDGLWLPSDHPTVPLPETSTPQLHLPLGTLTHPSTGGGHPPHTRQGLPALAAPCYSQGHGGPRGKVTLRWPGQGQGQASQAGRGQRPVWRGWGTPGATALQRRRVPGVTPGRAEDDVPLKPPQTPGQSHSLPPSPAAAADPSLSAR